MAVRFALEPVLLPYYLWPAAALLLVIICARRSWLALAPLVAAGAYTYFHREPWLYWVPSVAMVGLAVTLTGRSVFVHDQAGTATVADPAPTAGTSLTGPLVAAG